MWQPAGRNGKPSAICWTSSAAAAAEQRAEAPVEAELAAVAPDEVEHRADGLALAQPQAASELLQEQRRAVGRPQHEQGVDGGHVDAFVEEIDREDDVDRPSARSRRAARRSSGGLSPQTAAAEMPASLKTRAMKRACSTLTQKPSARIRRGSSTRSITWR